MSVSATTAVYKLPSPIEDVIGAHTAGSLAGSLGPPAQVIHRAWRTSTREPVRAGSERGRSMTVDVSWYSAQGLAHR